MNSLRVDRDSFKNRFLALRGQADGTDEGALLAKISHFNVKYSRDNPVGDELVAAGQVK